MKAARHDAIKEQGWVSEVVQIGARWKLLVFSGGSFDGGKRRTRVTTRFIPSIYPVVLAPRRAIIAATQWPRLRTFRQAGGRNEEEGKKGREKQWRELKEQTSTVFAVQSA